MAASTVDELVAACHDSMGRVRTAIPMLSSPDRELSRSTDAEITGLLKEVDRSLRALEAEMRAANPTQRRRIGESVTNIKSELSRVRLQVQAANDKRARDDLMQPSKKSERIAMDARGNMIAGIDKQTRDTATLHHVRNMMGEAEEMGSSTLNELQQQRETIIRTTTKTSAINSLTDTAKRIVIGIQGRMCVNNFILILIILLLLGIIGVIVYFAYIKSPK